MKLFLDDGREPYDDSWTVVRSAKAFRDTIESSKTIPEVISFDHDLHPEHYRADMYTPEKYNTLYKTFKHDTGLECAKWLCEYCIEKGFAIPEIIVHSHNPTGSMNIASEIMNNLLFHFEEERLIIPTPYEQIMKNQTYA